jgi:hypothetical protein
MIEARAMFVAPGAFRGTPQLGGSLRKFFFPQHHRVPITGPPEFGFISLKRCSGTILMNSR